MNPKVFVIILTYNGKDDTIECINSVKKIDYDNYEIIVVDNASTDGTVEELKKRFPEVKIIETGANLGYTGGNNTGVEYALKKGCDYIFILNNDTKVDKNLLNETVKTYEKGEKIGIVGIMELNYFKPEIIESVGGRIDWLTVGRHARGAGERDKGQYNKEIDVNFVSGVGFLISRKVIEKEGLFDPLFVTYLDDTDLCARLSNKGYNLVVNPKAKIWHKVSNTTKNMSGYALYYITRNKYLFMKKNATRKDFWKFIRYYFIRVFPREIKRYVTRGNLAHLKIYLKSIISGTYLMLFKVRKNQG